MNKFRWGYNVNGQRVGSESYFLNHIKTLKPSWVLIMSNIELAQKVHNITEGQTNVIDRAYSTLEGNQWKTIDPFTYSSGLMDGRRHIWKYVLNEPNANVNDIEEVRRRNNWLAKVTEILTNNGYKVVVGNFAAGGFELKNIFPDNNQIGAYDSLLRILSERRNVAKLGLHEYTGILLPYGRDRWTLEDLRYREKVQPETWLYLDNDDPMFKLEDYRDHRVDYFFHLLRSNWLQNRCRKLGILPVEIVLTEFAWDRMTDVAQGDNNIYDILKDNHGVPPPYENIRGAYSLGNVWKYYFPNLTTSQAILEQFRWCEANYDQYYLAFLPFMWSFGDNWDYVDAFNFGADVELHNYLEIWSKNYDPNEIPRDPIVIGEEDILKPIGTEIDLAKYMVGDGRTYKIEYNWAGGGTFFNQTQIDGGYFYHVKGYDISLGYPAMNEQLWYDKNYIYRGYDTSPNMEEMYYIEDNEDPNLILYGNEWMERFVKVGDYLTTNPLVTFKYKANGQLVDKSPNQNPYNFMHTIKVHAIYETKTFQKGLTLNDVVELHGFVGGINGLHFETYYYAVGYGLVGWNAPTNTVDGNMWQSYIVEKDSQANLQKQVLEWFKFPQRESLPPFEEPEEKDDVMEFDINDSRWTPAVISIKADKSFWNIRPEPNTDKDSVGRLFRGIPVNILALKEEIEPQLDGSWLPIRFADDPSAPFLRELFLNSGWVRMDGINPLEYKEFLPVEEPEENFKYIMLPESLMNELKANKAADGMEFAAKTMELHPRYNSEEDDEGILFIREFAEIIRNWKTTLSTHDGILLIPEDTE